MLWWVGDGGVAVFFGGEGYVVGGGYFGVDGDVGDGVEVDALFVDGLDRRDELQLVKGGHFEECECICFGGTDWIVTKTSSVLGNCDNQRHQARCEG